MSLSEAGCEVEAACPARHPLRHSRAFARIYAFHALWPQRSLLHALEQSQPDVVVPCDELATQYLHGLYGVLSGKSEEASRRVRDLIAHSLGDPQCFPCIASRAAFLALAREEGIAVPDTVLLNSTQELEAWMKQHSLPAVLKADGTSGGEGVQIVSEPQQALRTFRRLQAPVPGLVVLKRSLVDRDHTLVGSWVRQEKRTVSVQTLVNGSREANIAFFAWKGDVLASVSAEVVQTTASKGPAAVVKILKSDALLGVAQKLATRLGLCGFAGLDFVLEDGTNTPYLIEINARVTQTCHLVLGPSSDLAGSLAAVLSGNGLRESHSPVTGDTIALFPAAWHLKGSAEVLRGCYQDAPWQEPALLREGLRPASKINRENWAALKGRLRQPKKTDPGRKNDA